MISLKKYLDSASDSFQADPEQDDDSILPAAIAAYGSALLAMASCGTEACPALGADLKRGLGKVEESLACHMTSEQVAGAEASVREQLQNWGMRAARHNQQKTREVKELLIVMAHTAESVGERDQRCAGQMNAVTVRLQKIASLDDLTKVRASIEESAAELKSEIHRMTTEGKAALEKLRVEVSGYQAKLEEAEHVASSDSLTGLRNRLWVEGQIERRMAAGGPLCVAIVDIDDFKRVNDTHGHLTGDGLLKQLAGEIKFACRLTDVIGRWGGDEFIILLDCGITDARAQIDRLRDWVCGSYQVSGKSGPVSLQINASIGVAEHVTPETMNQLLSRADAAMYEVKAVSRRAGYAAAAGRRSSRARAAHSEE
jgi:diguanylate cyclase (GGDEF)-like protein